MDVQIREAPIGPPPVMVGEAMRTMDGCITGWPVGMEKRYGFCREEALGRASAELLKTVFAQTQADIKCMLAGQGAWTAGAINYHADGTAIVTIVQWVTYPGMDGEGDAVEETHSDIALDRQGMFLLLADLIGTIARELSEAMTAVSAYNVGAQLAIEHGWLNREIIRGATTKGAHQLNRSTNALRLLRTVVNTLRETD